MSDFIKSLKRYWISNMHRANPFNIPETMLAIIRRFHCTERSADDLFSSESLTTLRFLSYPIRLAEACGSGLMSLIIISGFMSLPEVQKEFFLDNRATGNPWKALRKISHSGSEVRINVRMIFLSCLSQSLTHNRGIQSLVWLVRATYH